MQSEKHQGETYRTWSDQNAREPFLGLATLSSANNNERLRENERMQFGSRSVSCESPARLGSSPAPAEECPVPCFLFFGGDKGEEVLPHVYVCNASLSKPSLSLFPFLT